MTYTSSLPQSRPTDKVIIVEDDTDLRESIVKYMTLNGLEITGVGSALEFYKELSSNVYTAAILDICLPDQTGLLLAEYLRSNTEMGIIILTAKSTLDDKLSGYQSGADVFLVKPVDNRELAAAVCSVITRINKRNAIDSMPLLSQEVEKQDQKSNSYWCLVVGKWLLRSPCGFEIKLTAKEYDFLRRLCLNSQGVINRFELLKCLGYLNNEYGNRALESLVNRLRRKIISVCGGAPIQTAYGIGYSFSENITLC